jgi:hypothetical protein
MQCPVCRAALTQGPQCRRCKADLTLLFALEAQRAGHLAAARARAARGDCNSALAHLDRAEHIYPDAASFRCRAVVYLLLRDYPRAWKLYRRAQTEGA